MNAGATILSRIACTLLAGCLAGCTVFDYAASDSPLPESEIAAMQPGPRIALVLGSGGPRGYAHIGVMRVLEEAGIQPDLVVGSSVGAVLGAFWAAGFSAERIDAISRTGGPLTLFDFTPFADRGWIRGQRLQDYVNDRLGAPAIERLERRLVVVATRRSDKKPVFFRSGNLGVAVRASSAVPGILSPVGIRGIEYEDADESLPVAVRAARQAGARFVIAIDVSARPGSAPSGTRAALLERDLRRRQRIDPEVALADFLFHPDLDYRAGPRARYFDDARREGERLARAMLPDLLARLERAGLAHRPEAPAPPPAPAAQADLRVEGQLACSPDAFTTAAHFGISRTMNAASSSGMPATMSTPCVPRRSRIPGSVNALRNAPCRRPTRSRGKPAGPSNPYHPADSKPFKVSPTVGTSGSCAERLGPHTASARSRPAAR